MDIGDLIDCPACCGEGAYERDGYSQIDGSRVGREYTCEVCDGDGRIDREGDQ